MVFAEPRNENHEFRSKKHQKAKDVQTTKSATLARLLSLIKINIAKNKASKAAGICEYNNKPTGI
jgi:hypothetical protein